MVTEIKNRYDKGVGNLITPTPVMTINIFVM